LRGEPSRLKFGVVSPKSQTQRPKAPASPKNPASAGRALEIEKRLRKAMPEPRCELDHQNAWQLLVATILSAQSTDRMVNRVTPALFARYPTPAALAAADQAELETMVKSTGFFRNKAKSIRAASQVVSEQYGGEVPRTLDELVTLPGVARKTANVVLGTAYRVPSGMTVDTHAGRVARRLSLTKQEDPVKVERDLCELFRPGSWIDMGHRFVLHGRYVCLALRPRCAECPLNEWCSARQTEPVGSWTARAEREGQRVASRGDNGTPEATPTAAKPKATRTAAKTTRASKAGRRISNPKKRAARRKAEAPLPV
jgi:endonuclease-3